MQQLIIIAHNLRSAHNVGSLLRTADGIGVESVYLTGYTPYPERLQDERLPHLSRKINARIVKTALGAEASVNWHYESAIMPVIKKLRAEGYAIVALEQAQGAISLTDYTPERRLAVIIGREVEGVEKEILAQADTIVEIPMFGQKESFNVVQATAIFLSYCQFS